MKIDFNILIFKRPVKSGKKKEKEKKREKEEKRRKRNKLKE